jgi:hypothetical protein
VTRQPGFFGFQVLNSVDQSSSVDAPYGWPTGVYVDGSGPFIPWQDFQFGDPAAATLLNPTAIQLKNDGWLHETWLASVSLTNPPSPFLGFIGSSDHPRLHKSSHPIGLFNSETIGAGFKVRKGVFILSHGFKYLDCTSNFGVFFPSGILRHQIQRIKLYPSISGTITKHSLPHTNFQFDQAANFTGVLQAPTAIETWLPDKNDPPKIFEPKPITYGTCQPQTNPDAPTLLVSPGLIEVLIFWAYLTPADLPAFPLAFNTASDFFFVG